MMYTAKVGQAKSMVNVWESQARTKSLDKLGATDELPQTRSTEIEFCQSTIYF